MRYTGSKRALLYAKPDEIPMLFQLPRVGPFVNLPPVDYRRLSNITISTTADGGTRATPLIYNQVTISTIGGSSKTFNNFRAFIWCNTLIINNLRTMRVSGTAGSGVDAPVGIDAAGFGGPGASGGGAGGGTDGFITVGGGAGGTSGGNGQDTFSAGGLGYAASWAFDGFDYGTPGVGGIGGDPGGVLGPGAGGSAWGGGGGGGPTAGFNAGGGGGAGGVVYFASLSSAGTISAIAVAAGAGGASDLKFNGADGTAGSYQFFEISHNWSTLTNHPTLSDTWDNR